MQDERELYRNACQEAKNNFEMVQNTVALDGHHEVCSLDTTECIQIQQEHLNCVQDERELYRNACQEAKNNFEMLQNTIASDQRHKVCSLDTTMHYSFDFAQQVHMPSNHMQPGPIYFEMPQKCGIFGNMCEAIPRQINYLIDKASDVGKGANTTINYIHYANNYCSGQNKNNYFILYLAWRTINQLHHSIKYSFLIAGHTKFGPDCCFGVIKQAYKVTFTLSIYEFARLVDCSSTTGINKAQLVGTHDGRVIVPAYEWSSFLGEYFNKLPTIKKYQHFPFLKR